MSTVRYPVEHFYHGQQVVNDKPLSVPDVLARSSSVTPDLVQAALEAAQLPPLPVGVGRSWAVVRGTRAAPFVLVQAQIGAHGQVCQHYIALPSEVMRAVGGNIRALASYTEDELPMFGQGNYQLKPLQIAQAEVLSAEQQADDMLELMTVARDRMDTLGQLLGALVQGRQIVVVNAPSDYQVRVTFVEGIMALLPPSVRFAVTFAMHSEPSTSLDVQIRFCTGEISGENVLQFDWKTAKVTGEVPEDDYSRFVMSQLRLDISLMVERTRSLTAPTGWRMRQGDRLAEALAYGSYRIKVDHALLNNQPVNKDDVSRVLRSDPTLSDSLRELYARHLLKISLVMNDAEQADSVVRMIDDFPALELIALDEMGQAHGVNALRLVARWLAGEYALLRRFDWEILFYKLATAEVSSAVKSRDSNVLNDVLSLLQDAGEEIQGGATKIVDHVLPLATQDPVLAENLFLFAVAHLNVTALQHLLDMKPFAAQLKPQLRQLWAQVNGSERTKERGLLLKVARLFGEKWWALVLTRLAELARGAGRDDLVDDLALRGMAQLAVSPTGAHHIKTLRYLTSGYSTDQLGALDEEVVYQLTRVRLALEDYSQVATLLIQQSTTFFRGDRQIDYIKMIRKLFADTPIPESKAFRALTELNVNGIKSSPWAMAALGTLENRPPTSELDKIAGRVEEMILNDFILMDVIPPEALVVLLGYYARAHNISAALRVAEQIPLAADRQGYEGVETAAMMYRVMDSDDNTRSAGLDILRVFVRGAEDRSARQAVTYFGRELGVDVRSALQATYFTSRIIPMGDIVSFARSVQVVTLFLYDCLLPYQQRNPPELKDLQAGMSSMSGAYSVAERRVIIEKVLEMGREVVRVYRLHQPNKARDFNALIQNRAEPATALDLLRVIGGVFTQGRNVPVNFEQTTRFPLAQRSRKVFQKEVETTCELMDTLCNVYPSGKPPGVSPQFVRAEIQSQLASLDASTRNSVERILTQDLLRLVQLIELVANSGDVSALQNDQGLTQRIEKGRHKPRGVLEFLRYVSLHISSRG